MFDADDPRVLLTLVTAASPWFAAALIWLCRRKIGRIEAAAIAVVQFVALGLNAVSRQIVQNLELKGRLFDPTRPPRGGRLGPLGDVSPGVVAGAAVVGWILFQLWKAPSSQEGHRSSEDHCGPNCL